MKLRRVALDSFRQFIGQHLDLSADVTALVGRNDSGKTGFLVRLLDQHFYERVIHGSDRPRLSGIDSPTTVFSLLWDVMPADFKQFPLERAFGERDFRSLEVRFDKSQERSWAYLLDGRLTDTYVTTDGCQHLREEIDHHALFPQPHYLNVGEQTSVFGARFLMPKTFEARFYELSAHAVETLRDEEFIPTETLLLRLAGFRSHTRHLTGPGVDAPWDRGPDGQAPVLARDVQRGLDRVSTRITGALRQWWKDPPGLSFRARISEGSHYQSINSFGLQYEVVDHANLELSGAGLQWFVSFLVRVLFIEDSPRPLLLMFDEPAAPLHPGAQRSIVPLLNRIARRHQLVYTTHSPFMLDWNFPQRIRVFERDPTNRRTQIVNKPYTSSGSAGKLWDPLRSSIGTTMGGIITLGETTILVEGVSDQIILANVSAFLGASGRDHLDLDNASLVPYSEELSLKQLIRAARGQNARVCVLIDSDEQGTKALKLCAKEKAPTVKAGDFAERPGAIEDVIGVEDYIQSVNAFYQQFSWFKPFDPEAVKRDLAGQTLGSFLEQYFDRAFQQSFSKVSVAIFLSDEPARLSPGALTRLESLIDALTQASK